MKQLSSIEKWYARHLVRRIGKADYRLQEMETFIKNQKRHKKEDIRDLNKLIARMSEVEFSDFRQRTGYL